MSHKAMMFGFYTLALLYFAVVGVGIAAKQADSVADRVKAIEEAHKRIQREQVELRKYVDDRMGATDKTIVRYWKRYEREK